MLFKPAELEANTWSLGNPYILRVVGNKEIVEANGHGKPTEYYLELEGLAGVSQSIRLACDLVADLVRELSVSLISSPLTLQNLKATCMHIDVSGHRRDCTEPQTQAHSWMNMRLCTHAVEMP